MELEKIINILVKREFNTLTEEEQSYLNLWLQASAKNQELFKRLQNRELLIKTYHKYKEIDTQKARRDMERRIRGNRVKRRAYTLSGWSVGIASAIVIILYLFNGVISSNKPDIKLIADFSNIKPVEKKALLILDGGKEINLGGLNLKEGILKEGGKIISIESNRVEYEKDTQKELSKKILINTLLVPRGGEYSLILSDGTKIWLNADSKLKYPISFTEKKRVVWLEGEAYFEVAKDESKPFIVNTNSGDITVLGTQFNVKDYAEDDYRYTTLVKGAVSFKVAQGEETILLPGQQLIYHFSSGTQKVSNVSVKNYVSWKDKLFQFESLPFEEIMKILARWYDLTVMYESDDIKSILFSGSLDKYKNIDSFVKLFEAQVDIKFIVKDRDVIIKKKKAKINGVT